MFAQLLLQLQTSSFSAQSYELDDAGLRVVFEMQPVWSFASPTSELAGFTLCWPRTAIDDGGGESGESWDDGGGE
ncbi:unnamed protein product [Ilex paraguariensis]|uniref:Uncharacterized protein n=1 Tax=Ilex paraguariensis TaxID=185542 RepID=A0ABC8SGV0_9AQUA